MYSIIEEVRRIIVQHGSMCDMLFKNLMYGGYENNVVQGYNRR